MKTLFIAIILFLTAVVLVFFYLNSFDRKLINNTQFSKTEKDSSLFLDFEDKNKPQENSPYTDKWFGDEKKIEQEKLRSFAKAFVEVQAYLTIAGNNANYQESTLIVKRHGLSIETYTEIAKQMNENPQIRKIIQDIINKSR